MKKHFANFKVSKERAKQKRVEMDRRAAEPPSYHSRESKNAFTLDNEAQIEAAIQASLDDGLIQASLDDQYRLEEMA